MPAQFEFDISEYWRILLRRKAWGIAMLVGVVGGIVLVTMRMQPVWESSAVVRVSPTERIAALRGTELMWWGMQVALATEVELIEQSDSIHKRAADALANAQDMPPAVARQLAAVSAGAIRGAVTAEKGSMSDLIHVTARGASSGYAVAVADAVAQAYRADYIDSRSNEARERMVILTGTLANTEKDLAKAEQRVKELEEDFLRRGVGGLYRERLAQVDAELAKTRQRLADQHPQVQQLLREREELEKMLAQMPARELTYAGASGERDRLRELRDQLYRQVHAARIDYDTKQKSAAQEVIIVSSGARSVQKVSPNEPLNFAVGLLLGLVCAVAVSFLVEAMDTSIGRVEDIEERTGLQVMALVPSLNSGGKSVKPLKRQTPQEMRSRLVFNVPQDSMGVESYRNLREGVFDALARAEGQRALIVTSAAPREGKTLTSINLALLSIQAGKRVLLLEAEMRNPCIHRFLGISRAPGLSDVLMGKASARDCTRSLVDLLMGSSEWDALLSLPNIDSLHVLTSGSECSHPAELLGSPAMGRLVDEVRDRYDIVYIDTPPVMPVVDTFAVGDYVRHALMVYTVGGVSRHLLLRALKMLSERGVNVIGIVLNQIDPYMHLPSYYKRAYGKHYGYVEKTPDKSASPKA